MQNELKEKKNYFGWQHLRLLNIASIAKNAAWIALVVHLLLAGSQILQIPASAAYRSSNNGQGMDGVPFFLATNPLELIKLAINMAATLFQGFVYYLVLRGICLGLTMIVETDTTYRDQHLEEGVQ